MNASFWVVMGFLRAKFVFNSFSSLNTLGKELTFCANAILGTVVGRLHVLSGLDLTCPSPVLYAALDKSLTVSEAHFPPLLSGGLRTFLSSLLRNTTIPGTHRSYLLFISISKIITL